MARGKGYDPGSAANTLENANADFALALMAQQARPHRRTPRS